jgi:hypothetical protein
MALETVTGQLRDTFLGINADPSATGTGQHVVADIERLPYQQDSLLAAVCFNVLVLAFLLARVFPQYKVY